jgi:hypothetical protein
MLVIYFRKIYKIIVYPILKKLLIIVSLIIKLLLHRI